MLATSPAPANEDPEPGGFTSFTCKWQECGQGLLGLFMASIAVCLPFFMAQGFLLLAAKLWMTWNPLDLPMSLAPANSQWFILYRRDVDLCMDFTDQITLNSCMWPDLWRFANSTLEHQRTGRCVTFAPNITCEITSGSLQQCVNLTLTSCKEKHWSQQWLANKGRLQLQASLNQTGLDVSSLAKDDQQKKPYLWIDGEGQAAFSSFDQRSIFDLDQSVLLGTFGDYRSFQLLQVCDPQICGGRGRFHANCSCSCDAPSVGRMCSMINEEMARSLSCAERKSLGPARQYTYGALVEKLQDALNTFACFLTILDLGIITLVSSVSMYCCCCVWNRAMEFGDIKNPNWFHNMHETLLQSWEILKWSFVLIVCWNVTYLLALWALFPYYAMFRKGHWPHADRAILFCVGEMDFGSYILIVQVLKTIFSLKALFKTLLQPPNLQAAAFPWAPGISQAEAIVAAEAATLYALVGMAGAQLHQTLAGFLVCVVLILLEIAEIVALFQARRDNQRFASLESLFAVLQDLPEFLFTAFVSIFGSWNQYVLYNLVSSTIALLTTIARLWNTEMVPLWWSPVNTDSEEELDVREARAWPEIDLG